MKKKTPRQEKGVWASSNGPFRRDLYNKTIKMKKEKESIVAITPRPRSAHSSSHLNEEL